MTTTYTVPEQWDNLVESHGGHPLQLFGWGEVKRATGSWDVVRVADDNNFAQILIRKTPLGRFGYVPRGNNFDPYFLNELKATAKQKHLFMLRFEPNVEKSNWQHKLKLPRDHILIPRTIQLNLTQPAADLLAAMDAKTRQYIRRGERDNNLKIRPATKDDLPRILEIYRETASRANFPIHPDSYYQTIFAKKGKNNHIYVATIDNNVEAFLWCAKTQATCFELYGGATDLGFQHRANYILKWQTILEAQKTCKVYDLNGLLNDGISKFKLGFSGGAEIQLAPTCDLVINPFRYFLFSGLLPLFKRFRSARRTSPSS